MAISITLQPNSDGTLDGSYPNGDKPGTPSVVNVTNETQFEAAVVGAVADDEIVLAAGIYNLTNTKVVSVPNVIIRGATGTATDVELVGLGMDNPSFGTVEHGIWTDQPNLTVKDLTIKEVYRHGIVYNSGAQNPLVENVRFLDTGEQCLKANPTAWAVGVNNGIVRGSWFEYTAGTPAHPGTVGYTNGVDVHGGDGWLIQDNTFKNFHTPDTADFLWNPAILMWRGASNTIAERNIFIDVDRSIAFGLEDDAGGYSHSGGIIRNNMASYSTGLYSASRTTNSDGSIVVWDSQNTKVLHNSVYTNGNLNHAIEFRYATTGCLAENNFLDDGINTRDGATFTNTNNDLTAVTGDFVNPTTGNLRVTAQQAQQSRSDDCLGDIDKPLRANPTDVGAHEFGSSPPTGGGGEQFQLSDLTYVGAFRVPDGVLGDSYFAYGVGTMAYNPDNNSLFMVGRENDAAICEISIPALVDDASVSNLNTATVIQNFASRLGDGTFTAGQSVDRIGGLYYDSGQLFVHAYNYYNAAGGYVDTTLVIRDADNLALSSVDGYFQLDGRAHCSGFISPIPDNLQAELGGTHVSGLSGINIVTRSSFGPSAWVWELSDIGPLDTGGAVSATALLDYVNEPLSQALTDDPNNYSGTNNLWTWESSARYGFIPKGYRSYVNFGWSGGHNSYIVYKEARDDGYVCPGYCAYAAVDTYSYTWMFDVDDMVEVKTGVQQPYNPRPYLAQEFTPQHYRVSTSQEIGSGAYDPANNRLFLSLTRADANNPVVLVYNVRVP